MENLRRVMKSFQEAARVRYGDKEPRRAKQVDLARMIKINQGSCHNFVTGKTDLNGENLGKLVAWLLK